MTPALFFPLLSSIMSNVAYQLVEGSKKLQPIACNNCRRRKIRCDSTAKGGDACSNCISMKIECLHTAPRKKRGPPAGRSAQLKRDNIQSLTTSILSSTPFKIPEDEDELRRILKELASHIRTLERELAIVRAPGSSDLGMPESAYPLGEETTSSADHSDQDELSELLNQLRLNQFSERYTLSNRLMLIKTEIGAHPNAKIFKRPLFWEIQPWQITYEPQLPPLVFPPQDLLTHLLDVWFTKVQPFFPLLHRPTFERSICSGLHYQDRHFGETLLAVCAISSRQSDDPRVFTHGSRLSAGSMWMQQVNPVPFSFTEAPSLAQVQKLILYILFMHNTSIPYTSLTLTGLGIRLLQDMGIHRRKNTPPTVARELWKRAFWILNYLDLAFSITIGSPRAMSPEDYDVEFFIECDDEFWEQPDDLAFKQPSGQLCQLTYSIQMLKLISILERVPHALKSVPRRSASMKRISPEASHRGQQFVLEIDKALNDWLENIPVHLKWDPQCQDTILFHQSTMLYIMYFSLRMEFHRYSLATSPSSLEICVNAAHSCVLIAEVHFKRDPILLGLQLLSSISTSGILLLIGIWRAKRLGMDINVELEMVDVVKCMFHLERIENRNQLAGRLWDTIYNVISLSELLDVYNLVRRRQDFVHDDAPKAELSMHLHDVRGGPWVQGVEDFEPNSLNTHMAEPHDLRSNPTYDSLSDDMARSSLQRLRREASELDIANTQQSDSTTSNTVDISEGDWAEYMASIDEVLRSLQQS
ncbi:fungal-specific transcription factor domain-containing protein [Lentinula raphanica]|nr:fungal-specific transcription factor domain-containing protein [Lentinula raphanica]